MGSVGEPDGETEAQSKEGEGSDRSFNLHKISRTGKLIGTKSRLVVAKIWGKGEMWSDCLMGTGLPFEMKCSGTREW